MASLSHFFTTTTTTSHSATMDYASRAAEALTVQEALSGVFGSISLATWIFLLLPQLYLNYKTGNAEGISLAFLLVWMVGDIANLSGAIWAQLVPTVIALAVYFCFADLVLISQVLYYQKLNASSSRRRASTFSTTSITSSIPTDTEEEPLLARQRSNSSLGLPGSQRRRPSNTLPAKVVEEQGRNDGKDESTGKEALKNAISIALVCAVGAAGWAAAWRSGVWKPTPDDADVGVEVRDTPLGAEILGYASAVCYLGARIPQIIKNHREKSCEGLALLFFLLSLLGNATYGAGILFHSLQKDYLWTNLPWLIGSLGTMVEDGIIFVQFRMYRKRSTVVEENGQVANAS